MKYAPWLGLLLFIGCYTPPAPPPTPTPVHAITVIAESENPTPEQGILFRSLRAKAAALGVKFDLVDPQDQDQDGKKILSKNYDSLPWLLSLRDDKIIWEGPLPSTVDECFAPRETFEGPHIDCDFRLCPEYTKGDLTAEDSFGAAAPSFEDNIPVIPREKWDSLINLIGDNGADTLVTRIYNQGRDPSCTSNATCQATEVIEQLKWGKPVKKSAMSLYRRVGGPGSGSTVSDNLDELVNRGVLPLTCPENAHYKHTMANSGYTNLPSGWEETARLFKGNEYFVIKSTDGFYSALFYGYPVIYGRAGHAICAVKVVKKNGGYYVKYANSWGDWGDHGFGYDSESMIRSGSRWAVALRTVNQVTLVEKIKEKNPELAPVIAELNLAL